MLLLAIDTSGKHGSVALARAEEHLPGQVELIEKTPLGGGTFSAQLVPQIATLLASHGFARGDVDAFVVVSGPGSFTGLRIGLAAVKALAEVLKKPIVAVSLLEVCAFASRHEGKIMAVLDAGRNEVYVGEYELPAQPGRPPREHLLSRTEFLAQAGGWKIVTPDSVLAEVAREAGLLVSTLPPVSAAEVARLGWLKLGSGEMVTAEQLEANYMRRTDAEMLERLGS
jgi:tRNA threonylcarbamoyladenosine biosynthesis protein TsaB